MKRPLANGSVEALLSQSAVSAYAAFAFDAFYAFIIAINQLLHAGTPVIAIHGELLKDEMFKTSFTGVSGEVSFDGNGDRLAAYELWNVQITDRVSSKAEAVVAASFSASTLAFTFYRDLVWMDGSNQSQPPPQLYSCDPGFYKEEQSRQCKLCLKGKMCQGGASAPAIRCPRGSFANDTGQTMCQLCAAGRSARDVGSVECAPCLPGYEAPEEGMEACTRRGRHSIKCVRLFPSPVRNRNMHMYVYTLCKAVKENRHAILSFSDRVVGSPQV